MRVSVSNLTVGSFQTAIHCHLLQSVWQSVSYGRTCVKATAHVAHTCSVVTIYCKHDINNRLARLASLRTTCFLHPIAMLLLLQVHEPSDSLFCQEGHVRSIYKGLAWVVSTGYSTGPRTGDFRGFFKGDFRGYLRAYFSALSGPPTTPEKCT